MTKREWEDPDASIRQWRINTAARISIRNQMGARARKWGGVYSSLILSEAGLVSYWRLDEPSGITAMDSKGTNTGTYTGGPTLGQVGAVSSGGTAVAFNGTTQYIAVPDANSLDLNDTLSIEAWVKPSAAGAVRVIVCKGSQGYNLRLDATNNLNFLKDQTVDIVHSTIAVAAGWHHCVVTKATSTNKLYIDAVDVTGAVTNAPMVNNAIALGIGAEPAGAGSFFNGSLDEVAIYSVALTPAQIAAHYAYHA